MSDNKTYIGEATVKVLNCMHNSHSDPLVRKGVHNHNWRKDAETEVRKIITDKGKADKELFRKHIGCTIMVADLQNEPVLWCESCKIGILLEKAEIKG